MHLVGRAGYSDRVQVLVERERELSVVRGLLDRGGGVVVLEGGVGIGKTSLLDACCERAGALGYEVLRGRGSELESDFPFGVVRQLFERTVTAGGADLLSGPAGAAAGLLGGVASPVTADDASFAVMHGLYWVAANLTARGPVLVAVDDAHWADEASLRWLAYLARRVEGLALSLIVALRPLDPVSSSPALLAGAEAASGHEAACALLERALELVSGPRERAEIALEVAETYASLFRWVDAVDLLDRALAELGDRDAALAARLEGELVVSGLHDARRAMRVGPVLERLASRDAGLSGEPLTVAQGMISFLSGRPANDTAPPLEAVLRHSSVPAENWDTRAALLWVLVAAERFGAVEAALDPMLEQVQQSGSARGLVAVYSTLGLLKLRLGALPDADAGARVALEVLQEGDFAPGIGFAATVLADVAVEAGQLDEAQGLLDLLPPDGWPPGVGTVLIPAARGRLRLAQRRPAEALADFESSMALFGSEAWGMRTRETGYVHARAGAAIALLRLGEINRARELAEAELADSRVFGMPRAIGVSLRAAGLARGGDAGLALLSESVSVLRGSPALLERAHSLTEFGAALRRAGERAAARGPLGEALDLAARCGATSLAANAREELSAAGARPRRVWRTGVEALTPGELRVARLAAQGYTNREIAHELYVTLKTVEGHLSRVYSKLDIGRRQELDGVLEGKTRV